MRFLPEDMMKRGFLLASELTASRVIAEIRLTRKQLNDLRMERAEFIGADWESATMPEEIDGKKIVIVE